MPTDAHNVLCAQLMRDLFAIAKFLFRDSVVAYSWTGKLGRHFYHVLGNFPVADASFGVIILLLK